MDERVSKFLNNPKQLASVVGIVAFGAGAGIGYLIGHKNRRMMVYEVPKVSDLFSKEELAHLEAIQRKHDTGEEIPLEVAEAARQVYLDNQVKKEEPVLEEVEGFAKDTSTWDYDAEIHNRTDAHPYVLHKDEFYGEEMLDAGYMQLTLTYYAGDNILVDDDDESPVYNHESVVGPMLFGHGSEDPNVFYVRNDKRKCEYEILFDPGLYSVEVLGLEIEDNERVKNLKHSGEKKFKKDKKA